MATFNPRVFTNPSRLKEIDPNRLIVFLSTWSDYFIGRGLDLTAADTSDMPFDAIAAILMNPDQAVPESMVNALYYVHETARKEPMDELIERAEAARLDIDHDEKSTPPVPLSLMPLACGTPRPRKLPLKRRGNSSWNSAPEVAGMRCTARIRKTRSCCRKISRPCPGH